MRNKTINPIGMSRTARSQVMFEKEKKKKANIFQEANNLFLAYLVSKFNQVSQTLYELV